MNKMLAIVEMTLFGLLAIVTAPLWIPLLAISEIRLRRGR